MVIQFGDRTRAEDAGAAVTKLDFEQQVRHTPFQSRPDGMREPSTKVQGWSEEAEQPESTLR